MMNTRLLILAGLAALFGAATAGAQQVSSAVLDDLVLGFRIRDRSGDAATNPIFPAPGWSSASVVAPDLAFPALNPATLPATSPVVAGFSVMLFLTGTPAPQNGNGSLAPWTLQLPILTLTNGQPGPSQNAAALVPWTYQSEFELIMPGGGVLAGVVGLTVWELAATAIPEPATFAAFAGLGALALVIMRRLRLASP